VNVEGLDAIMIRPTWCCAPVARDETTGFITMRRGVAVHRADCQCVALADVQAVRLIEGRGTLSSLAGSRPHLRAYAGPARSAARCGRRADSSATADRSSVLSSQVLDAEPEP